MLALVKSGLFGRKHAFVPLLRATVGRDYVRVAYSSEQIGQVSEAVALEPAETLVGLRAQQLAAAYGVEITAQDLHSKAALDQRLAVAREAEDRAAELQQEAEQSAHSAQASQAAALEHSAQAAETARAAEEAREEAERLQS